jgi:hypothetical protein
MRGAKRARFAIRRALAGSSASSLSVNDLRLEMLCAKNAVSLCLSSWLRSLPHVVAMTYNLAQKHRAQENSLSRPTKRFRPDASLMERLNWTSRGRHLRGQSQLDG